MKRLSVHTRLPRTAGVVAALSAYLARERPRVLLSPGNQTHVTTALAHALSGAGATTRLVVKMTNPIVKAQHGLVKRWYRHRLYGRIFSRASSVLVLSPERRDEIAAAYPRQAGKVAAVHNPYLTPAMTPGARAPDPSGEPVIVAAGRLAPQKNHALLLRAVARLTPPWRLVVLGTGPEEPRLRGLAAALGVADRVRFEGHVADPIPYYRNARLLALASDWEDLPAVVLEAMACGCPAVVTACSPSLVALMDQVDYGAVTPPGDEAAFAAAMAGILADPPPRRVPAVVRAYDVDKGVAEHLAAFGPWLAAR